MSVAYLVASGCGNVPRIPTLDQIRDVPDSDQLTILPAQQIEPRSGVIGSFVTVYGKGEVFPRGFVSAVFSGGARTDFELDEPTQRLSIRVPVGANSGPFGFTISGRSRTLENFLPTAEVFRSFQVEFPGFTVLPDPIDPNPLDPVVPEISPPASS